MSENPAELIIELLFEGGEPAELIEYDPTKTSARDLEALIKSLNKSLKK